MLSVRAFLWDQSTGTRHTKCLHHCRSFIFGFIIFRNGNGVRDDASPGLDIGATVRDLLRLVISRGLRLTIAGVVIGAAAALLLTRLMGNLLYKVSPRDPIAFGAALIILIAVALVACFLPARRATRIDPVRALRI